MRKNILVIIILFVILFNSCYPEKKNDVVDSSSSIVSNEEQDKADGTVVEYPNEKSTGYNINLTYEGLLHDYAVVYAAWIENENEENIQNLYICNSVVGIGKTLLGDVLPYWKTVKSSNEVDVVTGASVQGKFNIVRALDIGNTKRFKVCFEIDRSANSNDYFHDRPSFVYKSAIIDLDNLAPSQTLNLIGWMANDTDSPKKYSQKPKFFSGVHGFKPYTFMNDLDYIEDPDTGAYTDLVTSLWVQVEAK